MGLPVRVVLYAATEAEARRAAAAAFARVEALEEIFSDYRADSEVSRLSARAQEWVPVSGELFARHAARDRDRARSPTARSIRPSVRSSPSGARRAARTRCRQPRRSNQPGRVSAGH